MLSSRRAGQGSRDHILYRQVHIGEEGEEDQIKNEVYKPPIMDLRVSNRPLFFIVFSIVQIPGILAVILMALWNYNYKGGFSWTWDMKYLGTSFNWHPLLLTTGLIYLYGNGALVYRVFPSHDDAHKLKIKMMHAITMMIVFILTVIGLQAAFNSHNLRTKKDDEGNIVSWPNPNMYTLHSWIGLLSVILFTGQGVLGFLGFLFPKFSPEMRSVLLPFHQYFGSAIFATAVAAALMGLLEKAIWSIKTYSQKDNESILVNVLGVSLVVFAMGVTFLLSKFEKGEKRRIEPTENTELYTTE